MPFTQITLAEGKSDAYRTALMDGVYLSMRETIASPEEDRFATVSELPSVNINNSGDYAGVDRSDDIVFIQITLNAGRTTDQKKALYAAIARNLEANPGVRKEDIVINLVEVALEDWSLGNGEATYA